MSDEQEDYTRSFVTRSDIDKEAAWEVNKKKIEKSGYVYIRHTSDEYVSGIRNASDGVAWGASQLNLKDLKGAVGAGADYDDTDIKRELAAQSEKIEENAGDIADLEKNKSDEGHTHDDFVTDDHNHDEYQPKGDYATKTELSTGLAGKANDPHTHDYAEDDHDHDLVYQPKGDYATDDHGHNDYETKVDANLVHEALTESLAGKADDDHNHSGMYSPFDHGHENLATDDHAHDEYQPKGNYADSVHIHTEYAETGDIEKLDAAIQEEARDRAHSDGLLQEQVTANKESIEALSEKGYDDSWIQPALDNKSDEPHTHDDLATGDHAHDDYLTSSDLPDPYDDTQVKQDIQSNADAIEAIQSNGYDDTQIRQDFAEADARTLGDANDYTDEKIGAIPDPVPYDDTQVKSDIQTNADNIEANKQSIEALGEKGYDDTGVKADIQANTEALAGKADEEHDHEYLTELPEHEHPHNHDEYLTSSDLPDPYDDTQVKSDIQANTDAIAANKESIEALGEKGYDDTQVKQDIQANADNIAANKESIEALGEKGYDDTGVKQDIQANADAIAEIQTKGYDDTELRGLIGDKFDDGGAATYTSAKAMEDAIGAIVVPDVSDFVTETEMNTALAGKADEPHTHDAPDLTHDHTGVYAEEDHSHDEYLTDLTHDHSGTYQPVGDYATKTELSDGLDGKSDDSHTHAPQDTTHDHTGEYQPVGDYATNTDLGSLEGRVSTNETDIAALQAIDPYDDAALKARVKTNEDDLVTIKLEQITQNTDIQANKDAIEANQQSIEALGEKGYDDTQVKSDIQANADAI